MDTALNEVEIYKGKYFKSCEICGWYFKTKKSHLKRRKTCSRACGGVKKMDMYLGESNPNYGNRGELNPIYKGGYVSNYGYKMIKVRENPNAQKDGYVLEHRLIMSEFLGRPLRADEHIHHIDGDKLNNDISNLMILSLSEHTRLHNKERKIVRDRLGRIKDITVIKEENK